MAEYKYVTKENLAAVVTGLGDKFEAKDASIVKDASYVHTDNNFTDALAAKLGNIDAGAEVNVIDGVQVNGADLTPDASKKVNVTIAQGDTDGTIKVNGIDVAVKGLGTAAFEDAESIGEDNVIEGVQVNGTDLSIASKKVNVTITEGDTDGTIKANGVSVAVHGLGSAAYADTSAFGDENVIEGVKVGSSAVVPTNKVIELGTAAGATVATVLANDATLPTGAAVQTYVSGLGYQTSADVATAIAGANHITMSVVASLTGVTGASNVIYLVPDDDGGDNKDMYIYDNGEFVLVGNTAVDLSGYVQASDLGGLSDSDIAEILA